MLLFLVLQHPVVGIVALIDVGVLVVDDVVVGTVASIDTGHSFVLVFTYGHVTSCLANCLETTDPQTRQFLTYTPRQVHVRTTACECPVFSNTIYLVLMY